MALIDKSKLVKAIQKLTKEQLYPGVEWADEKRGRCPYHQSKSGNSFNVNENNRFHCSGCGVSGDPVDYLYSLEIGKLTKCPGHLFTKYATQIMELAGSTVEIKPRSEPAQRMSRTAHKPTVLKDVAEYTHQRLLERPKAIEYLVNRGVSLETIEKFQIGYYDNSRTIHDYITKEKNHYYDKDGENGVKAMGILHQRYNGYLTFPWFNATGNQIETMYFRYVGTPPEGKPKTQALPGIGSKGTPLFLHHCLEGNQTGLLAVEGVIDGVSLIDKGLKNIVAYVGASFSNEQIETMKRHNIRSVNIIADADKGGQKGLESSVIRLFNKDIDAYSCSLPDDLDPNDYLLKYGFDKWQEYTAKSKSALSVIVDNILAKYASLQPIDTTKNEIINEVRDFTNKLETNEGSRITKINVFVWDYLYTNLGLDRREI